MKYDTPRLLVTYDEAADVLRVTRQNISNRTLNLEKDINTTIVVDLENRTVAGLTIGNFSLAYPPIYAKLIQPRGAAYMVPQIDIALSKLTDTLQLEQVIQEEAAKSPVSEVLNSTLVGT